MEIRHDEQRQRFVLPTDGGDAVLRYRMAEDDVIHFSSTFVPPDARGQGYGARLVEAGLEHAREQEYAVTTTCWFVDQYLDRNPEYQDLLADSD